MALLDVDRSIVVAIDFQGKLMEMIERPKLVVASAVRLIKIAGLFKVPILMTEQYSKGLGGTHAEIRAAFDAVETEDNHASARRRRSSGSRSRRRRFRGLCSDGRRADPPRQCQTSAHDRNHATPHQ